MSGLPVVPLAATAVAGWFAVALGRGWSVRRSPYLRSWAIAMAMYAAASAAVAAGAWGGWSEIGFRVYWAFGAVLNVPLLALGEVELLASDRRVRVAAATATLAVAAATLVITWAAPLDPTPLAAGLPSGRAVLGEGTTAYLLAERVAVPSYLLLVAGALWSAWRMRGRPELRRRAAGVLCIVAGATLVASAGSAFAAAGDLDAFSAAILAGAAVMFAGFRLASGGR